MCSGGYVALQKRSLSKRALSKSQRKERLDEGGATVKGQALQAYEIGLLLHSTMRRRPFQAYNIRIVHCRNRNASGVSPDILSKRSKTSRSIRHTPFKVNECPALKDGCATNKLPAGQRCSVGKKSPGQGRQKKGG